MPLAVLHPPLEVDPPDELLAIAAYEALLLATLLADGGAPLTAESGGSGASPSAAGGGAAKRETADCVGVRAARRVGGQHTVAKDSHVRRHVVHPHSVST